MANEGRVTTYEGASPASSSGSKTLSKDLWIYGPNTQIAKYIVGGLKNPYSFADSQFDIFCVFVEKSVNSELCLSELYSNKPKFEIYPKMNAHVWAAWKTSSSELTKIWPLIKGQ